MHGVSFLSVNYLERDSHLNSLHLDNLDWITDSRHCHNFEPTDDRLATQEIGHHATVQDIKSSKIHSVQSKSDDSADLSSAEGPGSDMKAHLLSSEDFTCEDGLITQGDGSFEVFASDYNRIVSDNAVSNGNVKSWSPSVESSLLVLKTASEASSVSSIEPVPCRDESLQQMLRRKTEEIWRLEKEGLSSSASGTASVPLWQ